MAKAPGAGGGEAVYAPGKPLHLVHFIPTTAKVRRAELHPVLPWVLFCTDTDVTVWDSSSNNEVCTVSPAGLEAQRERDAALLTLSERRGRYFGSKAGETGDAFARGPSPGNIVRALFVDADVAFWQSALLRNLQCKSATEVPVGPPGIGHDVSECFKGRRWLLVVCEFRVLLFDLRSRELRDLSPRNLDKPLTDACVLFSSGGGLPFLQGPLVLASCLDGRAYILSMSRMRAIGYCAAESKGAGITCVAPAPAGERVGPDHVLVGCKDGSLHLFNPWVLPSAARSQAEAISQNGAGAAAMRSVPPAGAALQNPMVVPLVSAKHKLGAILQVLPASMPPALASGAAAPSFCAYVLSDDKALSVVALPSLAIIKSVKPAIHGTHCSAACLLPVLQGSPLVLACPRDPALHGTTASLDAVIKADRARRDRGITGTIANLSMLPVGPRKTLKVYGLTSHPTQPGLIAASASSGLALLCLPHPVAQPAAAVFEVQATPTSMAVLSCSGGFVTVQQYRLALPAVHSLGQAESAALERPLVMPGQTRIVFPLPLDLPETPDAVPSPSGRQVVLVWRELRHWVLAASSSSGNAGGSGGTPSASNGAQRESWSVVASGTGCCAAWDRWGGLLALSAMPAAGGVRTDPVKRKEQKEQLEAAERAKEFAAWAMARLTVQALRPEGLVTQVVEAPLPADSVVVRLFGGALLGVVTAPKDAPGRRQSRVLRFHSWGQGCRAVTPSLPEPLWVEWAAWDDVCAVGSDDGVHVLRATRRSNGDAGSAEGWVVQRVHSVHVPRTISGAWFGAGGLLLTTVDEAWLAVVAGVASKAGLAVSPHAPARRQLSDNLTLSSGVSAGRSSGRAEEAGVEGPAGPVVPWAVPGVPRSQAVPLASLAAHPLSRAAQMPSLAATCGARAALGSTLTQTLPTGSCKALGFIHGHPWVLDSRGWPHVLPLLLPLAQVTAAVALGRPTDAADDVMASAVMRADAPANADLRAMVAARVALADTDALELAAKIPGVPPATRLALCLARGDLPAALGHLLACLGLTHESVSRGQGDDDSGGDGNGADGAAHDANLINLLEADLSLSAGLPSKTGRAAAVNPDGSVCFDAFRGTAWETPLPQQPARSFLTSRAPSTRQPSRHHSRRPSRLPSSLGPGALAAPGGGPAPQPAPGPGDAPPDAGSLCVAARGPPGAAAAVADAGVAVVEAAADVCVRGGGREPGRSVLVRAARAVVACAEVFGEEQLMRVAAAVAGAAAAAEGRGEQPWADAGAVLVDMADAVAETHPVAAALACLLSAQPQLADAVLPRGGLKALGAAVEQVVRGTARGSVGSMGRFDGPEPALVTETGRVRGPWVAVDRALPSSTLGGAKDGQAPPGAARGVAAAPVMVGSVA